MLIARENDFLHERDAFEFAFDLKRGGASEEGRVLHLHRAVEAWVAADGTLDVALRTDEGTFRLASEAGAISARGWHEVAIGYDDAARAAPADDRRRGGGDARLRDHRRSAVVGPDAGLGLGRHAGRHDRRVPHERRARLGLTPAPGRRSPRRPGPPGASPAAPAGRSSRGPRLAAGSRPGRRAGSGPGPRSTVSRLGRRPAGRPLASAAKALPGVPEGVRPHDTQPGARPSPRVRPRPLPPPRTALGRQRRPSPWSSSSPSRSPSCDARLRARPSSSPPRRVRRIDRSPPWA